ncbi:MAG TPA: CBS domain-containing protein [Azospirillum sp.]|nr:CBS domain-containing protein [Azospirillum sp.]
MYVAAVIKRKGSDVVSIAPERTIAEAVDLLTENGIGAVLVLDSTGNIHGILSERDIVNGLSMHGADALIQRVDVLMARDVQRCSPHDAIADVMKVMTERRTRHLAVMENDKLAGLISIGDVVKQRLIDMDLEVEMLRGYMSLRADL